jgi:hypothetical protein
MTHPELIDEIDSGFRCECHARFKDRLEIALVHVRAFVGYIRRINQYYVIKVEGRKGAFCRLAFDANAMANAVRESIPVPGFADHVSGGDVNAGRGLIRAQLMDGLGLGFKDDVPYLEKGCQTHRGQHVLICCKGDLHLAFSVIELAELLSFPASPGTVGRMFYRCLKSSRRDGLWNMNSDSCVHLSDEARTGLPNINKDKGLRLKNLGPIRASMWVRRILIWKQSRLEYMEETKS